MATLLQQAGYFAGFSVHSQLSIAAEQQVKLVIRAASGIDGVRWVVVEQLHVDDLATKGIFVSAIRRAVCSATISSPL